MNDYYIPLISSCLDGVITDDGAPLAMPLTIQQYADDTPDVEVDDDGGTSWPNLMLRNRLSAPVLVISGVPVTGIIAGSHPANAPHRPK